MPTVPRASKAAAGADSGMLGASIDGRHAGRRAEFCEIAGETIRHIHRGAGMIAHRFRERVARLRYAVAPDQSRLCRGIVGESRGNRRHL